MSLTTGTQLGSYEVLSLLGRGGMGEVYRARDTKLKREVAIKTLPEEFSRDPERLARFQREAEALAALNHPGIAHVYGLEESANTRCIVMELVEGETLQERLEHGAIPVEEALQIARQIAEALEAAHERGIVHRDLKPGNIMLTVDSKVKVLDFGLAKALQERQPTNLSNSPTMLSAASMPGMILGTAAYMSPEQARGETTDHRTDIFAFGCVLYEMVTGRPSFQGKTVSDVLASVLAREADLNLLPPMINPRVTQLLRRTLDKEPKRRWQTVADMRAEIEAILTDGAIVDVLKTAPAAPFWKRSIPVLAASLVVGLITGFAVWNLRPAAPRELMRFSYSLPEDQQFSNTGRSVIALSPDGTKLVYVANQRLWLRKMSEIEARPILGTETQRGGVLSPAFSPDGGSMVYWANADQTLKKIAVSGGAAVTLCPADSPFGVSWDSSGIVFGQGAKGIMRVSANGGKPETLVSPARDEIMDSPQLLPDGQSLLFTIASAAITGNDRWDKARIVVQSLKSGTRKVLVDGGSDGRYIATGHLVYAFAGTLRGAPFNLQRLEVAGGAVPVVEGIMRASANTGVADFSVSQSGTMALVPGPLSLTTETGPQRVLAFVDRKGTIDTLKLPPGPYEYPRISPDGKRLAFDTDDGKEAIVWIYDLSGASAVRRLTFGGSNRYPIWAGNSERVAFQSTREGEPGIFWQSADGGAAEPLTKTDQGVVDIPASWPLGSQRFTINRYTSNERDLWMFDMADKKATPFAAVPGVAENRSDMSRDGRWVAYEYIATSNVTPQNGAMVFVQPYPSTGAKYQISPVGTNDPVWSPDGRELFYNAGGKLMAVDIKTQPAFTFSEPRELPIAKISLNTKGSRNYDITPDGKRFIVVLNAADRQQAETRTLPQIQIVLNWFEELKQRVPVH
jgi:serine/threonine-protein kinase